MSNAPVSATNTAAADNPNQPQVKKSGGKVKGQVSQTPNAVRKRDARAAAAAANTAGSGAMGQMAGQLTKQNASKINSGNNLSEMLAANIAKQKKQMAEDQAAIYESCSIFVQK
jgi:hypothetical protein